MKTETNHNEELKEQLLLRWGVRAELIKGGYNDISGRLSNKKRPSKRWRIPAVGAAAAAAIVVAALVLWRGETPQETVTPQVILELADGSQMPLGGHNAKHDLDGAQLTIDHEGLSYQESSQASDKPAEPATNRITVPRGAASYRITLSDGTRVWLNSGSTLTYPVRFGVWRRSVFLSGEAWFEVVHDAGREFVVESAHQSVSVLGTQFNVSAYSEDAAVVTTLAEGSVRVSAVGGGSITLTPGQQAMLNTGSGRLTITATDAAEVAAWKDGIMSIDGLTLGETLTRISRRYDVRFDELPADTQGMVLRGSLPSDESLDVVLGVLGHMGGVNFNKRGDGTIGVSPTN